MANISPVFFKKIISDQSSPLYLVDPAKLTEEELDKFKEAARLEAYSSYSEFIRRTALKEADKVIVASNERKTGERKL